MFVKQCHFYVIFEVQKDLQDISVGIVVYKIIKSKYKRVLQFDIKVGTVNFDLALYNKGLMKYVSCFSQDSPLDLLPKSVTYAVVLVGIIYERTAHLIQ
jgi:hypothetical protein